MITNMLDKSGITYTTGTKYESAKSLKEFRDAVFETIYNTGTSIPVHQVPTQPCGYNYNYCPHRLPCGICRLTNTPCSRQIQKITPIWQVFPTVTYEVN